MSTVHTLMLHPVEALSGDERLFLVRPFSLAASSHYASIRSCRALDETGDVSDDRTRRESCLPFLLADFLKRQP